MISFNEYKQKVSIIQVAEHLGYQYDPKEGKLSPVYKLKDDNGIKIDEIVIKNPTKLSDQHYFDRNYKGGDVIQFIKNHINDFPQFQHSNSFVHINKILAHFANVPYEPSKKIYESSKEKIEFNASRYSVKEAELKDLNFLTKERHINPVTIHTFLPFIKLVTDLDAKANYTNIAFPFVNPLDKNKRVTNYELRNYGFKGMATGGDKQNSVWLADFCPNKGLVKDVFFGESAIDLMSYYQLNKPRINIQESVFVSVGGYISENQIRNTIKAYPNANTHTCFDNDINGHIYDIKTHNILANKEVSIKINKAENNIQFKTPNKEFSILFSKLSLSEFRKESNIFSAMKTHKAKGFNDFNDVLQSSKSLKI